MVNPTRLMNLGCRQYRAHCLTMIVIAAIAICSIPETGRAMLMPQIPTERPAPDAEVKPLLRALENARNDARALADPESRLRAYEPALNLFTEYFRRPSRPDHAVISLYKEALTEWDAEVAKLETPEYIKNKPVRDLLAMNERQPGGVWRSTMGIRREWSGRQLIIEGVPVLDESGKERQGCGICSIDGWSPQWTDLVLDIEFFIVTGEVDMMLRYRPDGSQPFTCLFKTGEAGITANTPNRMTVRVMGSSVAIEGTGQLNIEDTLRPSVARVGGVGFAVPKGSKIIISRCDLRVLHSLSAKPGLQPQPGPAESGVAPPANAAPRDGEMLAATRIKRKLEQKDQLEATEKAVEAGLEWLKRHQRPDGSWDPLGYPSLCDGTLGESCRSTGSPMHRGGMTGLAVLTFLGAGHSDDGADPYSAVVKNGLKWLWQHQDSEGCFGRTEDPHFIYDHACAALAMCEAYASTRRTIWKDAAQKGLDFIVACKNPYKAWRYGVKPGDNDSSVTGWMLMALKSGETSGLQVPKGSISDGLAFLRQMTDEFTGRTGYTKPGELPVRQEGMVEKWPGSLSESLTAVAMCSRIFTQGAEVDEELLRLGANLLSGRLPVWDEAKGTIDMYYWYYGTLAMFQIGGADWTRWERSFRPMALEHQVKSGCMKGSWDPKDPWADDGGRIYSTALMTMCLEAYYRYPRMSGVAGK